MPFTGSRQPFFPKILCPAILLFRARILFHVPGMFEEIVLHESQWLGLYRKGHWDYVKRPNSDACVGILAMTDREEVVLVEQFRIPVGKKVIEIPAGLVGDEVEFRGESLAQTATRELLEETGYRAASMELLVSSPTSAGMTPELTHLFYATGLTQENAGGGTETENIIVHRVPIAGLREFLSMQQAAGMFVDFKIHAALAAAGLAF